MIWFWIFQGFWICFWFWICQGFQYIRVLKTSLFLSVPGFRVFQCYLGFLICLDRPWIIPGYAWLYLNMSEYAWICLNFHEHAKTARIAFVLDVPFLILCLLKRVITYFNEVYSLKEWDCFLEETKFSFFYSSWKYLIFVLFCFVLD